MIISIYMLIRDLMILSMNSCAHFFVREDDCLKIMIWFIYMFIFQTHTRVLNGTLICIDTSHTYNLDDITS